MDSRFWWWLTRAAGIVAWVIVAAAVVWGLLASTKMIRRRGVPAWILDLHRYLGTLTIVFVAIHVAAVWLDSFVKFDAKQLFVPFASSWRPHAVAWGIFGTYLLVRDPDHVVGDAQAPAQALAPGARVERSDARDRHRARVPRRNRSRTTAPCSGARL